MLATASPLAIRQMLRRPLGQRMTLWLRRICVGLAIAFGIPVLFGRTFLVVIPSAVLLQVAFYGPASLHHVWVRPSRREALEAEPAVMVDCLAIVAIVFIGVGLVLLVPT